MTIQRDDPRFWDVRTLERRFRKGQITKKDLEKHLKTIADAAGKQAPIDLSAVDDDDDDDLDDEDDEDDKGPNGAAHE